MNISPRAIGLLAGLAALAAAPAAQAAIDRTVTIDPTAAGAQWSPAPASGLNTSFFLDGFGPLKGSCGKDVSNYCDQTLVHVTGNILTQPTLSVKFRIDGFNPQASDFDLRIYDADADGNLFGKIGSPQSDAAQSSPLGSNDPRSTAIGDYETTVIDLNGYEDPATGAVDAYFVVLVPYFTVANGTFTGHATLQ